MSEQARSNRTFDLEGCVNFRDLGGYESNFGGHIKWRTIFRSDSLHRLTRDDVGTLSSHQIRLSAGIDIRSANEVEAVAAGALYDEGAPHHRIPFHRGTPLPDIPDVGKNYRTIVLENIDVALDEIFESLANPSNYPLAIYCSAGKDRTGMTIALLLRALGVSDEEIVADYVLSDDVSEILRQSATATGNVTHPNIFRAPSEAIQCFLTAVDARWGSAEAYM